MPYVYVYTRDDGEQIQMPVGSLEAAVAQGNFDSAQHGGPRPRHVLDGNGVVAAAWKDTEEFHVEQAVTEVVTETNTAGQPVEVEKVVGREVSEIVPLGSQSDDAIGAIVVRQDPLDGAELAAYADEIAQQEG